MTTRTAKTNDAVLTQTITREVAKRVVGQEVMVERLLIGLLTGGHILLEGVPGLAKTLAVKTVAECLKISFSRIQFTPDLLPSSAADRPAHRWPYSARRRAGTCQDARREDRRGMSEDQLLAHPVHARPAAELGC